VIFTVGHSTRSLEELVSLLRAHGVTAVADIRTIPRSRRHPHFAQQSLESTLPAQGIAYRHFPGLGGLRKPLRDSKNSAWRHAGFRGFADYMQTPEFARELDELIAFAACANGPPVLSPLEVTSEGNGVRASASGGAAFASLRRPAAARRRLGARGMSPVGLTSERNGVRASASGGGAPGMSPVGVTPERNGVRASASGGGAPRVVIMCAEAIWWRCHRQLVADALVARGVPVRHIMSADASPPHVLTDFARVINWTVTYPGLV